MPDSLHLIFAGAGEFGLPTLAGLLDRGHRIVSVITQLDRPAGRGRAMTPTPVAAFAAKQNLPLLKTADINSESLLGADAMVVIAFGQKIADPVVRHPRLGSINLHASLLPRYRGAAPINWAIIRGEKISGNSVIRLASRMDAGAILGQSRLEIGELETAGELHDRLAADGLALVLRVLDDLAAGTAIEIAQDESRVTIAPKLSRESSRLDFSRSADELANRIRGMYPWPGCRVRLLDDAGAVSDNLTLIRCRPVVRSGEGTFGTIISGSVIATAVGALEVIELQPQGKRPMSLAAYRNGHRWDGGMRVESMD